LDDVFELDTPILIARDLVSKMKRGTRPDQLAQVAELVQELQREQLTAVANDLKELNIDWSAPPANDTDGPPPESLSLKLWTDRKNDKVKAGEPLNLNVSVTNRGTEPVYQLHAITKSHAGYYDQRELVFGKVDPGKTVTATVPFGWCETEGREPGSTKPLPVNAKRTCRIPRDAVDRQDDVSVEFFAAGSEAPEPLSFRPTIESLPRPIFAYSYQVADNRSANRNGVLEKGEGATVYLHVKNVGTGPTYDTQANLQNLTGDGVLLKAGRFDISNMKPGEEREVAFTLDVLPTIKEKEIKVELSMSDRDLGAFATEKLVLPVFAPKSARVVAAANGTIVATTKTDLFAEPSSQGELVGQLSPGVKAKVFARTDEFVGIELGAERFAYVRAKDVKEAAGAAPRRVDFQPVLSRSPPRLSVKSQALSTRGSTMKLDIQALDDNGGVQDVFVFVGSRKVFYMPNPEAGGNRMKVSMDVPLKPGVNMITVVARQNEDSAARYRTVVRKDGPNGEALPTPKNEVFGEDWEFGDL
jgi:carboxyl-terminal processing protease